MKDYLTIVPRKKYMNKKKLLEKMEAGLVPVIFFAHNVQAFYGFLLSREIDIANAEAGEMFDMDYNGEIIHAQYKMGEVNEDGFREYRFEIVDDEDFIEKRVPVITSGVSLGEKKGANIYLARNFVLLRGRTNILPDYIKIDVTNVDVNQKMFMRDLDLPRGAHFRKNLENELVLECKYKYQDVSLLDAYKGTFLQEAI